MIKLFKNNKNKIIVNGELNSFYKKIPDKKFWQHYKNINNIKATKKQTYKISDNLSKFFNSNNINKFREIKLRYWDKRKFIYDACKSIDYNCEYNYLIAKEKLRYYMEIYSSEKNSFRKIWTSLKEIIILKKSVNQEKNDSIVQKQKALLLEEYLIKKHQLWVNRKTKLISRSAYKNERKINRMFYKSDKRSINLSQSSAQEVENLKSGIFKLFKLKSSIKKVHKNNILYIRNLVPYENLIKGRRFLSALLSFICPGMGSIMNRNYIKGIIMILSFAALTTFTVILDLGMIGEMVGANSFATGDGIRGLITLGKHLEQTGAGRALINSDFMLVEGTFAVILTTMLFIYMILSARNSFYISKAMESGKRNTGWKGTTKFLSEEGAPYLVATPVFIIIAFASILPLVTSILIAFTNSGEIGHQPPSQLVNWVGLQNLKDVFDFSGRTGKRFLSVLSWTFIWGIGSTASTIFAGTFLALIVNNERIKGKPFIRLIYILPIAVPGLITILYFKIIFSDYGFVNQSISRFLFPWVEQKLNLDGVETTQILWKSDANSTKSLLFVMNVWLGFGGMFILVSGLLNSIPKDLYEAAEIDGAGTTRKFQKITGPILLRQVAPMLIGAFVSGLNNFGLIYLFNDGGPSALDVNGPGKTDILLSYVFKLVLDKHQPALAGAFVLVLGLVLSGIGLIGFLRSKTFREDY